MLDNFNSIINKDIYDERIIKDVIHFASTKQISVEIINENIKGSTVINNVTISLSKSFEFQKLIDRQKELEEHLFYIPEEDKNQRLKITGKLNHQKQVIDNFVREIILLAEKLQSKDFNSERSNRARELFDEGKFKEANDFWENETPNMLEEQEYLLSKIEKFNEDLKNNANDFFIAALTSQYDYENPNHFKRTCDYFDASIKSFPTFESLSAYASFLNEHNEYDLSQKYYQRILDDFEKELSPATKTAVLYNLGEHYDTPEEYEEAISELQILIANHKKTAKNEYDVLPTFTAQALFNLGNFHIRQDKVKEAIREYKESVSIYQKNVEDNPNYYLPRIASGLMTLGKLYVKEKDRAKAIKELSNASEIYSKLSPKNPKAFLQDLRDTYYVRGACFASNSDYEKSIQDNLRASEITRQLDTNDSWINLQIIADSLEQIDFCQFKQGFKPNEKYLLEAISLRTKLVKETSEIHFYNVVQSTLRLCWGSYHEKERYQDAISLAEKSLALARELKDKESLINRLGTLEIILLLISSCLVEREFKQGLKEALEGRRILFSLKESSDLIGLTFQMCFLLTLGYLYVRNKQIEKAIEVAMECMLTASFAPKIDDEWQEHAKNLGRLWIMCDQTQETYILAIEGVAILRGANIEQIKILREWAKTQIKNE